VQDIPVRAGTIRLGQFLKLANLLDSGAEAKQVIAEGGVQVDGEVELRRGRQLGGGEVVSVAGGGTARVRTGGDPGPTPGHPPQR
jgi:ribosome-associated protein